MVGDSYAHDVGSWVELPGGRLPTARPRRARGDAGAPPRGSWLSRRHAASAAGARWTAGPRRLIAAVAAAAALLTLVVSVLPFVRFAYRSSLAHASIDTAATVISSIAAVLLFQRFRRTGVSRDLLLVAALGILAAANLLLSAVPAIADLGSEPVSTWALLAVRLLGAALLAAACLAPRTPLRAPARAAWWTLAAGVATVGLVALLAVAFGPHLPRAVEPGLGLLDSSRPHIVGHPLMLAGQVIGMVLFATAGIAFARRAETGGDDLMAWLAAGAVMAAFARLNYFLCPSVYTDVFYTGDFFNLAFYVLLLVGAIREIDAYHRRTTAMAVLEERRRIARDMHDGLAQELAFIASRVRTLQDVVAPPARLDQLINAAERALDDSRAAIGALTRPLDEPLDAALARSANEVAERLGAHAELDLERGVEVPPATREALVRIVREAVANAVRHGRAARVDLALSRRDDLRLTVADDGCGFDPGAQPSRPNAGFGLVSMRERAEALGGTLDVSSARGAGTTIEVLIPCPSR
jgi:signal transduction histidine kinase